MPFQPVSPVFPDIEASVRLMSKAFTEKGRRALMLDLSAAKVPTAGGLGQLVALHTRLRASGGQLVLSNVSARAYEVFEVTRLTELLDVRRCCPDADKQAGPQV